MSEWLRLHVVGEGQTECSFVKRILAPYLYHLNIASDARAVLTRKNKRKGKMRGGLTSYQKAKYDIETWVKEDNNPECRFTTMFDLYALPDDFPGFQSAQEISDPYGRVKYLEEEFRKDIGDSRFIPCIQLHEFEALILASPGDLNLEYLDHDRSITNLIKLFGDKNPELINDGKNTAPSKRIIKEIPEYDKATAGVAVVEQIGINLLRERCSHFGSWIQKLEELIQE